MSGVESNPVGSDERAPRKAAKRAAAARDRAMPDHHRHIGTEACTECRPRMSARIWMHRWHCDSMAGDGAGRSPCTGLLCFCFLFSVSPLCGVCCVLCAVLCVAHRQPRHDDLTHDVARFSFPIGSLWQLIPSAVGNNSERRAASTEEQWSLASSASIHPSAHAIHSRHDTAAFATHSSNEHAGRGRAEGGVRPVKRLDAAAPHSARRQQQRQRCTRRVVRVAVGARRVQDAAQRDRDGGLDGRRSRVDGAAEPA